MTANDSGPFISRQSFLTGRVELYHGDSRKVLKELPHASIDAVVTDPPYALVSISKRFGSATAAPLNNADERNGRNGPYHRASAGFMGQRWDTGEVAFDAGFWAEVLRVLKPGGHVLACGGTRTYHRLVCAIEDGGFEIRDAVAWLYGSGFPKSHDIGKAIDRVNGEVGRLYKFTAFMRTTGLTVQQINDATGTFMGSHYLTAKSQPAIPTTALWARLRPLCGDVPPWVDDLIDRIEAERPVIGRSDNGIAGGTGRHAGIEGAYGFGADFDITAPATDLAKAWDGWGSALKPAMELCCLARKPLEGTLAQNIIAHGVGGLNIDGCRVPAADGVPLFDKSNSRPGNTFDVGINRTGETSTLGRWPANVVHDGSEEVLAAFAVAGERPSTPYRENVAVGDVLPLTTRSAGGYSDTGTAARFFYTAKADADGRAGSAHPTVKPVDLMRWLVRLVTPVGGVVLDPFAGSGTTGEAAFLEGMRAVLIEREDGYCADVGRRLELLGEGPEQRALRLAAVREERRPTPWDEGTLFA